MVKQHGNARSWSRSFCYGWIALLVALGVFTAIGMVLVKWIGLGWLSTRLPNTKLDALHTFFWTYWVGGCIASVVIPLLVQGLRWLVGIFEDSEETILGMGDFYGPALLGTVEVFLYPMSLLMGKGEFIGVWLALKVAGGWVRWTGEGEDKEADRTTILKRQNRSRRRFNVFLLGNAFCVIAGAVIYFLVKGLLVL